VTRGGSEKAQESSAPRRRFRLRGRHVQTPRLLGGRHPQVDAVGCHHVYLADKHGAFGGQTKDERQDVLRWLFFDNHKFTSYFATFGS
jgi:hypothetical protein